MSLWIKPCLCNIATPVKTSLAIYGNSYESNVLLETYRSAKSKPRYGYTIYSSYTSSGNARYYGM